MLSNREELSDGELDGVNGGINFKEFKADLERVATAAITVAVYVAKKVDDLLK
jgi:hypothetical protein